MPLEPQPSCPGSLGLPRESASKARPGPDVGTCPVCGQEMPLGYAGLLPLHHPAEEADRG